MGYVAGEGSRLAGPRYRTVPVGMKATPALDRYHRGGAAIPSPGVGRPLTRCPTTLHPQCRVPGTRTMQRKPRCEVEVSTGWGIRAAGR
jgi:hypothetical protein